mgnify:CR=1 FL=1
MPAGALAPDFALPTDDGRWHSLTGLLDRGRPLLVWFIDPQCSGCKSLLAELSDWQERLGERVTIQVISRGSSRANHSWRHVYPHVKALFAEEWFVASHYQAYWTPAAALIDGDGFIAADMAFGPNAVRALMTRLLAPEVRLPLTGAPLPAIERPWLTATTLVNAAGETVQIADILNGHTTALLSWDAQCTQCQSLEPALTAWSRQPPAGAPRLFLITTGPAGVPEALRASQETTATEGLRFEKAVFTSLFALDDQKEGMAAFVEKRTPKFRNR